VSYDTYNDEAWVGSGALLGEFNEVLEKNGRAVPSGSCPTVGVGGQAIAGGFGLTSR
jgi:FAD/FMN-containing dehydrogenase